MLNSPHHGNSEKAAGIACVLGFLLKVGFLGYNAHEASPCLCVCNLFLSFFLSMFCSSPHRRSHSGIAWGAHADLRQSSKSCCAT